MKSGGLLVLLPLAILTCYPSDTSDATDEDPPGVETNISLHELVVEGRVVEIGPDYFQPGSVSPYLGRLPVMEEFEVRAHPVTVLNHSLWQGLGGGPDLLGATVLVGGDERIIIGITPPEYAENHGPLAWVPLQDEGTSSASSQGMVAGD